MQVDDELGLDLAIVSNVIQCCMRCSLLWYADHNAAWTGMPRSLVLPFEAATRERETVSTVCGDAAE